MKNEERIEAVDVFFATNRAQLVKFARWICGGEAEDAVQEAYIRLRERVQSPNFRWDDAWTHYALRVVKNTAKWQRRQQDRGGVQLSALACDHGDLQHKVSTRRDDMLGGVEPPTDADSDASPSAGLERYDRLEWLQRQLGTLNPVMKETLWLKYVEGLSGKEIADLLGLTEGAVHTRNSRGITMLRGRLPAKGELAEIDPLQVVFLDLGGSLHRLPVALRPRPITDEDGRLVVRLVAPIPEAVPPAHAFALLRVDDGEVIYGSRPAHVALQLDPESRDSWLARIDVRRFDGTLPQSGAQLVGMWLFAVNAPPTFADAEGEL